MPAPVVHTLEDTIAKIKAAQQPQYDYLDSLVAQNETSGTAQVQGIDAAKTGAFGQIAQAATNKGMTFSGFTPNEQASYLGSTYLPQLAKLQEAITGTRKSLFGKKADLTTQASTSAIDINRSEQSALDAYNAELEKQARDASEAERQRQFTAAENSKDRQLSASNNARSNAASAKSSGPVLSKNAQGGWSVSDNMDLAQYARATGADLITLLSQGDAKDRQAAKYYMDNIRLGRGEAYAMDRLMNYDRPSAFYRGG